jgi:DnaK suppressor protein
MDVTHSGHSGHSGTAATLRTKKAEIEQQLGVLEETPGDQGSISFGKRVGEGTSMAVDRLSQVAVHDKLQKTLADVNRAMDKLADGSYGRCDACGEPVGDERLEALPWATLCVRDAGRR